MARHVGTETGAATREVGDACRGTRCHRHPARAAETDVVERVVHLRREVDVGGDGLDDVPHASRGAERRRHGVVLSPGRCARNIAAVRFHLARVADRDWGHRRSDPHGPHERRRSALDRPGRGLSRRARPRLSRARLLVAPPDPRARRRRLSRAGARPAGLRRVRSAGRRRGLRHHRAHQRPPRPARPHRRTTSGVRRPRLGCVGGLDARPPRTRSGCRCRRNERAVPAAR